MNLSRIGHRVRSLLLKCASMVRIAGINRPGSIVSRRLCTYLVFDLAKVPGRFIDSAIALQLQQSGLFRQPGFAFRLHQGKASVWCWEEALDASAGLPVGKDPIPEPLLRPSAEDGLVLIECSEGIEARWTVRKEILKSRWYPIKPTDDEWDFFCRDCKQEYVPLDLKVIPLRQDIPEGWRVHTTRSTRWNKRRWALVYGSILIGCVFVVQLTTLYKLEHDISASRVTLDKLRAKNSELIERERAVSEAAAYISALYKLLPRYSQQELMTELLGANIVGIESGVQLSSWKYQGGQVAMGFALKDSALGQSAFLARFGRLRNFSNVRLPIQSNPGEFVVQAEIMENSRPASAEVATNKETGR